MKFFLKFFSENKSPPKTFFFKKKKEKCFFFSKKQSSCLSERTIFFSQKQNIFVQNKVSTISKIVFFCFSPTVNNRHNQFPGFLSPPTQGTFYHFAL